VSCKTQTIRKILDHERTRTTLVWVPNHKGIQGNEKANQAAKEALNEDISTTERYPPDDLKKLLTEEDFKKIREQKWNNGSNEMKEKKPDVDRKEDTQGMPWKEQLARDSEPGTRGLRWKGLSAHFAPSATFIYPSTTYCGNGPDNKHGQ
jgi:hypothetical protein